MGGATTALMPDRLVAWLGPGAPGLLLTIGADGFPNAAWTWAVALDAGRLRAAVDAGGATLANLQRTGLAAVQLIGDHDMSFLVSGCAREVAPRLAAAAPLAIGMWELQVVAAKNQSWPGASTTALAYTWPAEQREAMLAMERAVYAEMRDAAA